MNLNKNNNGKIITKLAKSNIKGQKIYSIGIIVSIILAIGLISTLIFFLSARQVSQNRSLESRQQFMFFDITEDKFDEMAQDDAVEKIQRYKESSKIYFVDDVKFKLNYLELSEKSISDYTVTEGRAPEKANEIVVDTSFMNELGLNPELGANLTLSMDTIDYDFIISGYTNVEEFVSTQAVFVSKEFADTNPSLSNYNYTVLFRTKNTESMSSSEFEAYVQNFASNYDIEKINIRINKQFYYSLDAFSNDKIALIIMSIIIIIGATIVIYSIFFLSINNRIRQLGRLKAIGMTKNQIHKMIYKEAFLYSVFSIPISIIIGAILSFVFVPTGFSIVNILAIGVIIFLFGTIIIRISIRKSAKIAGKTSPIDAIKNTTLSNEKVSNKKHRMLQPKNLALINVSSHKKQLALTTISLAVGGILFMIGATYLASWDSEEFSRQSTFKNAEYAIEYNYDRSDNYPITLEQQKNMMNTELINKLSNIDNVKEVTTTNVVQTKIEFKGTFWDENFSILASSDEKTFSKITDGTNNYDELVENNGILMLDTKLMREFLGIDFKVGDVLNVSWLDGMQEKNTKLLIAGTSNGKNREYDTDIFYIPKDLADKLWGNLNTTSEISISVSNYEESSLQIEQDIETTLSEYSNLVLYTLRSARLSDAKTIKSMNVLIYGFVLFIVTFSVLNLINTMLSSILVRKQELAMLQAIGMTPLQIKRMLHFENIFTILPNFLITGFIGTIMGYGLIYYMTTLIDYMHYTFPIIPFALYIVAVTVISLVVSNLAYKSVSNKPLAERVKLL